MVKGLRYMVPLGFGVKCKLQRSRNPYNLYP